MTKPAPTDQEKRRQQNDKADALNSNRGTSGSNPTNGACTRKSWQATEPKPALGSTCPATPAGWMSIRNECVSTGAFPFADGVSY